MAASQATKTMNDDSASTASAGNPAVPRQNPLTFFSLPREIRDTIYDHIWLHTPAIEQHWAGHEIPDNILVYSKEHYKEEGLRPKLTWLLTSKQMLEEGLDQLHRQAVWHPICYDGRLQRGFEACSLPLGPQCRRYSLERIFSQVNEQRGQVELAYPSPVRSLLGFVTDPRVSAGSLTQLRVHILHRALYNQGQSTPSPKSWKCHLPELEMLANLPPLQVFAIRLESVWWRLAAGPGEPPCATAVALEAALVEAFAGEAARVGEVVVPDGVEEVIDHPGEHWVEENRGHYEAGRHRYWEYVVRRC
jgi:hypothetical protein